MRIGGQRLGIREFGIDDHIHIPRQRINTGVLADLESRRMRNVGQFPKPRHDRRNVLGVLG